MLTFQPIGICTQPPKQAGQHLGLIAMCMKHATAMLEHSFNSHWQIAKMAYQGIWQHETIKDAPQSLHRCTQRGQSLRHCLLFSMPIRSRLALLKHSVYSGRKTEQVIM